MSEPLTDLFSDADAELAYRLVQAGKCVCCTRNPCDMEYVVPPVAIAEGVQVCGECVYRHHLDYIEPVYGAPSIPEILAALVMRGAELSRQKPALTRQNSDDLRGGVVVPEKGGKRLRIDFRAV